MIQKLISVGLIIFIFFFVTYCTRQKDFSVLSGSCFGQKVPGIIHEVFEPQIVSAGLDELNSVFSPDRREFYFCIRNSMGAVSICLAWRLLPYFWLQSSEGFGSDDLYISFKDKDSNWMKAKNMGES